MILGILLSCAHLAFELKHVFKLGSGILYMIVLVEILQWRFKAFSGEIEVMRSYSQCFEQLLADHQDISDGWEDVHLIFFCLKIQCFSRHLKFLRVSSPYRLKIELAWLKFCTEDSRHLLENLWWMRSYCERFESLKAHQPDLSDAWEDVHLKMRNLLVFRDLKNLL